MKVADLLNTLAGDKTPRAPRALLWVPPGGRPIEAPSVEAAQNAATAFSAEKPGTTVAVYELVGYAYLPVKAPEFTPADSDKAKAELRDTPPDTLNSSVPVEGHDHQPHRTDLSDAQRDALDGLRSAMRPEEP